MPVQVRGAVLSNFAQVAQQAGLDSRAMLREVDIDPLALTDQDIHVPLSRVLSLLEGAARASGWQNFGLRMAELRRLAEFGAVSLLIAHQSSLREGLETTIQYLPFINEALVIDLQEAGGVAVIRMDLMVEGPAPTRQALELAVGALFRMCNAVLGYRWRPQLVSFTHSMPDDMSVHRRLFGPNVQFGADFNGIVCAGSDLDGANPSADAAMASYATRLVDMLSGGATPPTAQAVRKAVYQLLPTGHASISHVARSLGMNARTLQRRLAAEEAKFSTLLNGARREMALRHLDNPNLSLVEVAGLLGYGELSSFTRWFAAEFGVPPSRWRTDPRQ